MHFLCAFVLLSACVLLTKVQRSVQTLQLEQWSLWWVKGDVTFIGAVVRAEVDMGQG